MWLAQTQESESEGKALKLKHYFRHFGVIYILMELANGKYLSFQKTPISLQISIISISL